MKNDDSQPLAQVVLPTQIPDSFSITDIEQITVQTFHILNNFDIPIGIQVAAGQIVPDMPSATQIIVAADLSHRRLYYRTMYNATIRCIDLQNINFRCTEYLSVAYSLGIVRYAE